MAKEHWIVLQLRKDHKKLKSRLMVLEEENARLINAFMEIRQTIPIMCDGNPQGDYACDIHQRIAMSKDKMQWVLVRAFYDYDGCVWNELTDKDNFKKGDPSDLGYVIGVVNGHGFLTNQIMGGDDAMKLAHEALTRTPDQELVDALQEIVRYTKGDMSYKAEYVNAQAVKALAKYKGKK